MTLGALEQAAAAARWAYGVDLASRDSATVGGTVATNAGGLHVLRYGDTRSQLVGIEAVLGTGAVVSHLGGLVKDNTGYDLAGLLCGSEGTLGVVTAARLRLVAPTPERVVALLAFDDGRRGGRPPPSTCGAASGRWPRPSSSSTTDWPWSVGSPGLRRPFAAAHRGLPAGGGGGGRPTPRPSWPRPSTPWGRWPTWRWPPGSARRAELWRYREAHTEAINTLGPPHKLDVTLPAAALADFIATVPSAVAEVAPGASVWLFGHAADGNIHVNVTGVAPDDERVDDAVLSLAALGGRQHQRRARHRHGQAALAGPQPIPGRAGGVRRHQARPRSRPACSTRTSCCRRPEGQGAPSGRLRPPARGSVAAQRPMASAKAADRSA